MNGNATQAENRIENNGALQSVPRADRLVVHDSSSVAYIMDTARFEHSQRIANLMAACAFMPDHLVKDPKKAVANCTLVLSQALRWQMDPFAIAPETYVVGGKLSHQGKLVAAVVNARAGLKSQLQAIYSGGKADALAAVIFGSKHDIPKEAHPLLVKYANEDDTSAATELILMGVLAIRVSVGQCKTANKMWITDPQQKLFYTGATKWARRFTPELMLGVITDDDFDRMGAGDAPEIPAGTSPRTIDDLNKAIAPNASVQLQTREVVGEAVRCSVPDCKADAITEYDGKPYCGDHVPKPPVVPTESPPAGAPQGEVEPDPVPDFIKGWQERIADLKRLSVATNALDDLTKDYRGSAEEDEHFYLPLFEQWVDRVVAMGLKASETPIVRSKLDGLKAYLPVEAADAFKVRFEAGKK